MATMALGNMQIMENELYTAAETHRNALELFGTQPCQLPANHTLAWPKYIMRGTT